MTNSVASNELNRSKPPARLTTLIALLNVLLGQRIRVLSSSVPVQTGDKTIFVNDFVISKDLGFVAGHKYEVSLWLPSETGRIALAKGAFTLK